MTRRGTSLQQRYLETDKVLRNSGVRKTALRDELRVILDFFARTNTMRVENNTRLANREEG